MKDSLHNNFLMMEYCDKSFSFFSKFLRENKGLVIAYVLISIISNLSARFINLDGIKTETLFLCVLLAFLIFYLPTTLLIKKMQNKMVVDIEGINAEISYKKGWALYVHPKNHFHREPVKNLPAWGLYNLILYIKKNMLRSHATSSPFS